MIQNSYSAHRKSASSSSAFVRQNFKDKVPLTLVPSVANTSLLPLINTAVFYLDKNFVIKKCGSTNFVWLSCLKKRQNWSDKHVLGKKLDDIFCSFFEFLKAPLLNATKGKAWHSQPIKHEKGDDQYWLQWDIFPCSEKDGEEESIVVCVKDITFYQQLSLTYAKLLHTNELLEGFNLILFHDLMQPLRQISNFLDIVREGAQGSMDDIFQILQKNIEHIRNLSEGITLYCRKGDLTVKPEKISLKQLLDEIGVTILMKEKYHLNCCIDDDVFLHANRVCMIQLFQNLLINAIKYSTSKSHIITLSGKRESENFYKFFLHNHGFCSNSAHKSDNFLPFHSFATEGAGLGLAICKKIISAYKGDITFHSDKNMGTTIVFTLPIYNEECCQQQSKRKHPTENKYILH